MVQAFCGPARQKQSGWICRSEFTLKIEATYDAKLGYPTRIVYTTPKDIRDGNSIVENHRIQEPGRPMTASMTSTVLPQEQARNLSRTKLPTTRCGSI